ncbi:hypothetical protein B4092_2948 [Bacillus licheniformis]|uniref:HTH cro/C1-type domain-containing protein n=1 Tax=Bacillus licheniformis TaxID=1402 RepID=A0A8B5Y8Q9_BACLI|nr:hypothetical protein B4092_2948 [Bacillus licheniformis]TWJ70269.1 hypothetical protein CHCC5020_0318 [Bacillus licheniformis]TWK57272.1 hypothetical protein CHCC20342_1923 [Bacillus licheniformis]TWL23699.1 hypothetical protein CHCC16736_1407 [Bacillus licheniformis]TWL24749.1 hypothetical protein CHCC15546_2677 [Bacillus licheniformis]
MKKGKTQREIAKERSYVSRIEKRALMKVFNKFYRGRYRENKKSREFPLTLNKVKRFRRTD